MAVYLNSRKLRIIGMTNHTHNKYKTVMEMMLRHKDTFPWERLVQPSLPVEAGRGGREGQHDPRKHEGHYRPVDRITMTAPSIL